MRSPTAPWDVRPRGEPLDRRRPFFTSAPSTRVDDRPQTARALLLAFERAIGDLGE